MLQIQPFLNKNTDMHAPPKFRPRLFVVLWLSLTALLYLAFAIISCRNYTSRLAVETDQDLSQTHLPPEAFFAMFWNSGNALLHHLTASWGLTIAPQPLLHVPVAVAVPFFHLTWLYPPIMGLLAMGYALFPLPVSFWVWRGLYFAISAALLRRGGLPWGAIALGLGSPAAMVDLVEGENGTLTGGLVVSAILLIETAPKTAGWVSALLSIKPQTGIALPFILLQRRAWPGLVTCAAGLGALVLATLPVFGLHGWEWFLFHATRNSSELIATPFTQLFPEAGSTVFYMARSFGLAPQPAMSLQIAVSLIAALALWRLWQARERPAIPRMAATLALSALLTPYGYLYDQVGFSIGMAALCLSATPARQPVYAALWLFAGHSATLAAMTGHIFMPLAAMLGAAMAWSEAAAPQTPPHARNLA
jgi:hypothetical protein